MEEVLRARRQVVVPAGIKDQALGLADELAGAFEGDAKLLGDDGVGRPDLAQPEGPVAQSRRLFLTADSPLGRKEPAQLGVHHDCMADTPPPSLVLFKCAFWVTLLVPLGGRRAAAGR